MINGHKETQRRLEKLYKKDPESDVIKHEKGHYYKDRNKPRSSIKFMKKYNNKRIRQHEGFIPDGSYYKKLNEHWWIIY